MFVTRVQPRFEIGDHSLILWTLSEETQIPVNIETGPAATNKVTGSKNVDQTLVQVGASKINTWRAKTTNAEATVLRHRQRRAIFGIFQLSPNFIRLSI